MNINLLNIRLNKLEAYTKKKLCCMQTNIENLGLEEVIAFVGYYSELPNPTLYTNKFYYVLNNEGTWWLPGSLGGTYYSKGFYYSDGVSWTTIDTPFQATQVEVNNGVVDDKFVTPLTFTNASKWNTKESLVNKATDFSVINNTKYPTTQAVSNELATIVPNATHTGDVIGSVALTIDPTAITGKTLVTAVGTDYVLISDTSDAGALKKVLVSDFGGGGGGGLTQQQIEGLI